MSYVTLAFSQQTSGVLGRSTVVGGLLLDAATSENLSLTSDVTDHEVEEGVTVSDHIRHRPTILTVAGLIGDASLAILPSAADLMSGAVSGLASVIGGGSWKDNTLTNPFGSSMSASDLDGARQALKSAKRLPSAGRSRLLQAVATLYAARAAKMPVVVVTGLGYYPDYYITDINFSRSNADTGGMLNVSVTMRTVRKVSSQTGTLVYPEADTQQTETQSNAKTKAAKTQNKGRATQKAADAETSETVYAVITKG